YCALWGVMISPMILYFLNSPEGVMDIARAFFITAGTFAGLSIFGYTTKRNLAPIAAFATMAVIGLIIVGLVHMIFFAPSSGFSLIFSVGTVLLFSAITAYEVQQIKSMYMQNLGSHVIERYSIFGALQLYGSFVVLFIHILNIIGIMRGGD
ncbi:MAG: Bax inhibitor-1 family protein, partial [Alphaproteobacteria bacterium]